MLFLKRLNTDKYESKKHISLDDNISWVLESDNIYILSLRFDFWTLSGVTGDVCVAQVGNNPTQPPLESTSANIIMLVILTEPNLCATAHE